tara:strand:- start:295 stop:486 length:192 start_codon:yes stop_codon:yes gene_type:complete
MKRNPTSVRLNAEQKEFIKRKAEELGCTEANLIRAIVFAYYQNHQRGGYLVKEVADIVEVLKT